MKSLLFFMIPPVVGAAIGFITNVVAIRMLFRPLGEIRVFGIRLPFTPGILPRQRHRLSQSIGGMVERELLTPETVRSRLAHDEVRSAIKASLSRFTSKVLASPPGVPAQGHEYFIKQKIASETEKLYPRAADGLVNFLRSDKIRRELETRGRVFLRQIILKLNVFQRFFLSAAQYDLTLEEKMPEIVDELIANAEDLLKDAGIKNTLCSAASAAVGSVIVGQDKSIGASLGISEDEKKKLDDFLFEKVMALADARIENVLASINIKTLVSDRIDSLDMLRVERIILDVMADQFKWIDIFGAVLGFLIGLFQAALNVFMR